MAYWGSNAEDSDYAATSIGSYIYLIRERMMQDIDGVLKKNYPEQSMIASIVCLRVLGERFPNALKVHFRRKHFIVVKNAFEQWYSAVSSQLPSEYRHRILDEAQREFALFEERILSETD